MHGVNSGSTCDAYTLTINQCPPCDAAISNVSATAESCLGNDDGTLTVTASCTTCSALEYSINGTDWQPGSTFNGLPPANYTVTVRDAGDESCSASTSAIVNPGTPGNALEQTNVVYHNPNSVTVYWSTIPGSTNYMMRYRPVGGAWTEITSLRAWRRLYSLSACTPYEVQFKNYIGGMWTCWSQFYYFTTPCAKTFGTGKNNNDLSAGMQVFPNPVSEVLNIVLDENMLDKAVSLTLRDQLGRVVWSRNIQNLETNLVELNVRENQLAAGVYMLSLQNADCVTTAQIVVNR